jgi:hypothetical protein
MNTLCGPPIDVQLVAHLATSLDLNADWREGNGDRY